MMSHGSRPREDCDTERAALPVPLDAAAVWEFAELVRTETGVTLSDQEAWARATELIALFRMLLGPLPEDPEA